MHLFPSVCIPSSSLVAVTTFHAAGLVREGLLSCDRLGVEFEAYCMGRVVGVDVTKRACANLVICASR